MLCYYSTAWRATIPAKHWDLQDETSVFIVACEMLNDFTLYLLFSSDGRLLAKRFVFGLDTTFMYDLQILSRLLYAADCYPVVTHIIRSHTCG